MFPLPGGDLLVTGSTFPGFENLYTGDKKLAKAYLAERKENEDYEVVTQLPWWWNGGTYTRGAYESLFYYDAKKKSLTRLTAAGLSVSDVQLTEDRKTVYYSLLDVSVPRPAYFGGAGSVPHGARLPPEGSPLPKAAPISISLHTLSGDPSCFCSPQTESTA